MDNKLFSLLIIPDSGSDVTTSKFNFKLVMHIFSALIVTFFVCFFFIVGYHIKLNQEHDYKHALADNKLLRSRVSESISTLNTLTAKLDVIQRNDRVLRLIESMRVIDDEMYMAGVGGHVLVDDSEFSLFTDDLQSDLKNLSLGVTTIANRLNVQTVSFDEIQSRVTLIKDQLDNTPTEIPTRFLRITSPYGVRRHPVTQKWQSHKAIDLGGTRGQKIYASASGQIEAAGQMRSLGNYVTIKHKYGYETLYGHLSAILVTKGDIVKKGDVIGLMGATGTATGVHLHYAVSFNGVPQNPEKYFR